MRCDCVCTLGSLADFDEMVARPHRAYCAIEILLVHFHAAKHAGNTVFREIEVANILEASLAWPRYGGAVDATGIPWC